MADKIYPDGFVGFAKRDGSPDWVCGDLNINIDDFAKWIRDNPEHITEYNGKRQLKLQITTGKNGRLSASVNTWKPNSEARSSKANTSQEEFNGNSGNDSDLPF